MGKALVAVTAALLLAGAATAQAQTFTDADGIHVLATTQIDQRDWDVTVLSGALGRPVHVNVLLPDGYDADPARRYPVLYLFAGTSGSSTDWLRAGDEEATTAGLPLIVVSPDMDFAGDGGGWFTDWIDTHTSLGPSQWETFHIDQVVPWIDANLRTLATRDGRAIAGLSQGGFGAFSYAARHPDMFVSAASFSGAPDIDHDPVIAAGATAVIEATALFLDGVEPAAMFGPRLTDEINWQGHDPTDLASNLFDTDMWLYTATGIPGPLDPPTPNLGASVIEALTHLSTLGFYQRAQQLGLQPHLDDYVFGTHTFPYWARDLREYVPRLMATLATPPPPPTQVSYQSIDRSWSQWGWSVAIDRAAPQQWSSLSGAGSGGFALSGDGVAHVTTPPDYAPGRTVAATLSGAAPWTYTRTATADATGRLHLDVPLGWFGLGGTTTVSVGQ